MKNFHLCTRGFHFKPYGAFVLYRKECRRTACSLIYLLFLALLILSWHRNFQGVTAEEISRAEGGASTAGGFDRSLLAEPSEADVFFGTKSVEDPEKIMCGMADTLLREYRNNSYTTYPLGYYRAVSLDEEEQGRILEILCEITGLTEAQLRDLPEDYFPAVNGTIIHPGGYEKDSNGNITIRRGKEDGGGEEEFETSGGNFQTESSNPETNSGDPAADSREIMDHTKHFISQVSYERFLELLAETKELTKGGYYYSIDILEQYFSMDGMDFEDAAAEYEQTVEKDRVTGGFARLYCDYMGLALGFYPVFTAVFLWLQDRLEHTSELIFSRRISSRRLVLTRYLACVSMTMLPVLLLSLESLLPLASFGNRHGISIDGLAYIKYILWWLLPTAMAAAAAGTFFTILTDTPIAVLVQFLWWTVEKGVTGLSGDTKLTTLMIRHNTLRGYEMIRKNASAICRNRLAVTGISAVFLFLSVLILQKKRIADGSRPDSRRFGCGRRRFG